MPFSNQQRKGLIARVALATTAGWFAAAAIAADETPPTIAAHERWVTSVAFLADGALASAGGESLQFRPGDVLLWNSKTGRQTVRLGEDAHPTNVWSLAASRDGKTLVTTGYDGKVIVWDVEKREARASLEQHKGWVRSSAISPDGKHFATGGEDGAAIVWSLGDEVKEAKTIKAHETAVYSLAFSPDGKTLATASTDKTAKLWDWQSDAEPVKLEGHGDAVWGVDFSPNGKRIATCSADRTIKFWGGDGKLQATLEGHKDWVSDIAFRLTAACLPARRTTARCGFGMSRTTQKKRYSIALQAASGASRFRLTASCWPPAATSRSGCGMSPNVRNFSRATQRMPNKTNNRTGALVPPAHAPLAAV